MFVQKLEKGRGKRETTPNEKRSKAENVGKKMREMKSCVMKKINRSSGRLRKAKEKIQRRAGL